MRSGKRYLGTTSSVLSRASGDEFGVVVLEQVFIKIHVFFFGQDGIVGFETILGKQSLVAVNFRQSTIDIKSLNQIGC